MSQPSILKEILAQKSAELVTAKNRMSIHQLKVLAKEQEDALSFFKALTQSYLGVRIIAECKKKSPSKGVFTSDYHPDQTAQAYERGGAAAISVLTDTVFFGGSLTDLRNVKNCVNIPVLRKDFIIDEYQIYEARYHGADSFLLLANVLDAPQIQYFLEIGRELGMEALVETHTKEELDTVIQKTDAQIVGVNNRNLNSFEISLDHSKQLINDFNKHSRENTILVCESGVKTTADIKTMRQCGYSAFLIGEALMTAPDPEQLLRDMIAN